MTKYGLLKAAEDARAETKAALQLVYDKLTQTAKKQIIKNEEVKTLFDRHGIKYE